MSDKQEQRPCAQSLGIFLLHTSTCSQGTRAPRALPGPGTAQLQLTGKLLSRGGCTTQVSANGVREESDYFLVFISLKIRSMELCVAVSLGEDDRSPRVGSPRVTGAPAPQRGSPSTCRTLFSSHAPSAQGLWGKHDHSCFTEEDSRTHRRKGRWLTVST